MVCAADEAYIVGVHVGDDGGAGHGVGEVAQLRLVVFPPPVQFSVLGTREIYFGNNFKT